MVQKNELETILNVELPDTQWKQATLPVHTGGGDFGVRSACMLAPSAFLASAAATLSLQEAILSISVAGGDDTAVSNIRPTWSCLANTTDLQTYPSTSNELGMLQSPQLPNVLMSTLSITGGSSKA